MSDLNVCEKGIDNIDAFLSELAQESAAMSTRRRDLWLEDVEIIPIMPESLLSEGEF